MLGVRVKLLVINNMSSGLGNGAVFDYVRSLIEDGDEVVIRSTDGQSDLRSFLHDADRFDCVVASGGDGTVSQVAYMLADTGIPIVPFPSGTANLLATNLESPLESHALASMTRAMNTMDFDLGELDLLDGTKTGFMLMAGAGYDAAIMRDAEAGKKHLGQFAYFTSAFQNASTPCSRIILDIDGKPIESEGVGVLLINFSKIQFDISVVHKNEPRDGLFDVVILHTKDAFGLIPALFNAILDIGGDVPERTDAFEIYQGREVRIDADPPMVIQFDGEVSEATTPFKASIHPSAARYVVSDGCARLYGGDDASAGSEEPRS